MDEKAYGTWRRVARRVAGSVVADDADTSRNLVTSTTRLINAVARRMGDDGPGTASAREQVATFTVLTLLPEHRDDARRMHRSLAHVPALACRVGHSQATGRPDLVSAAEARGLLSLGSPQWKADTAAFLRSAAGRVPSPVPDGDVVHHAPTWARPRMGRSRQGSYVLETDRMTMPRLDGAETALRLRGRDGTWVEVKAIGDDLYRPVLAPGSWEPVDVATFVEAVRDGVPWVDNPFHRGVASPQLRLHVAAHAAARARAGEDAARVAEARLEAEGVASTLAVIDGVVHARTGPPAFGLCAFGRPPEGAHHDGAVGRWDFELRWRLPDGLSSDRTQDVVAPEDWAIVRPMWDVVPEVSATDAHRLEAAVEALSRSLGDGYVTRGGPVHEVVLHGHPALSRVAPRPEWSTQAWDGVMDRMLHGRRASMTPQQRRAHDARAPGTGARPKGDGGGRWFDGNGFDQWTRAAVRRAFDRAERVPDVEAEGLATFRP